jgi:hypothetical protein
MKRWLEPYDWAFVTEQNAMLCLVKSALHKATSDGHEATRALWGAKHGPMDPFGRHIDYLRISVTDRCNERCLYCMPKGYKGWAERADHLTAMKSCASSSNRPRSASASSVSPAASRL